MTVVAAETSALVITEGESLQKTKLRAKRNQSLIPLSDE